MIRSGERLLHIGFHKTGTTALQSAFAAARPQLRELGIAYPGKQDHQSRPALAVINRVRWANRGGVRVDQKYWKQLVRQVDRLDRSVISSEFFSEAGEESVKRIIEDLGGAERVQVVATLRAFDRILPSSWQQYVKGGMRHSYAKWLKAVLADPPSPTMSPTFWQRHDHPAVLQRWADVVGPERVTLVVLDESDRSMMFRTFEQLLGLPADLLTGQPRSRENRSLTAAEAELVRQVNRDVMAAGITWRAYTKSIRYGAVRRFTENRSPAADEQPILTPRWAIERAAEIGGREAERIHALGISVVGDLTSLSQQRIPVGKAKAIPETVPLRAAVEAVLGTLYGTAGPEAFVKEGEEATTVTLYADDRGPGRLTPRRALKAVRRRVRRGLTRARGSTG